MSKNSLETEPVIKSVNEFIEGETFEELITKRFIPFCGLTEREIILKLRITPPIKSNRGYYIAKSILGISRNKIEEFEKGDIVFKTIRLDYNGNLKKGIPFSQIQFRDIIKETWEDSFWYNTLSHKFFFCIFKKNQEEEQVLQKVMFWNPPYKDMMVAEKFWRDIRKKIRHDDYEHFIKISDQIMCHVGTPNTATKSLMKTPSGRLEKKKCYWLNPSYIKAVIS